MTVDSLIGERPANLLVNSHVIKSGDQIYYGDKQVLTSVDLNQSESPMVGVEQLVIFLQTFLLFYIVSSW